MIFDELLTLTSSPNKPQLRTDSRLVNSGDIFAAIPGTTCDGHDFIDSAIKKGAKYILCQKPQNTNSAEIIIVKNSAEATAVLAQAAENNPASKLTNLAVTGTNGKTTVAFLVQSVIKNSNQTCGLIGTVTYDTGEQTCDASLTTPDCLTIAQKQSQMLNAGAKYMAIEASSHALDQNRLAAIDFKAAAFTNLAGDHLDYHENKQNYLTAKTKLFQSLSPDATAILNKQSPESKRIAEKTNAKILYYAIDSQADLTAHIDSMDIDGTVFTLAYADQKQKVSTPLLGQYNISNHLAAAGLCLAVGFDLKTIADGLSKLKTIPGRLEKLDSDELSVIIDYAHTDDALKNVLTTLKPLCKNNITVVFGCGGDRDKTKRPRMAQMAEQLADSVIITSDNPRTENPIDIINQIIVGLDNPASPKIKIEPDRKKAIQLAIKNAQKNDIILIAGKGHETYQVIGTEKFDFSDKQIAQKSLEQLK